MMENSFIYNFLPLFLFFIAAHSSCSIFSEIISMTKRRKKGKKHFKAFYAGLLSNSWRRCRKTFHSQKLRNFRLQTFFCCCCLRLFLHKEASTCSIEKREDFGANGRSVVEILTKKRRRKRTHTTQILETSSVKFTRRPAIRHKK